LHIYVDNDTALWDTSFVGAMRPRHKGKLEKMMYEKKVFNEYIIDRMFRHFVEGDLQYGVLHLAMRMSEHFIKEKVESMSGPWNGTPIEARTAEENELLQEMLDYLLDRVDLYYANAEDIRAVFE
tara:strand:+ start:222 stop:596 length:375 start_codon:yes stop_codon:yes gene_type:complete